MGEYLMMKLDVLRILEEKGKTKYWLYKQLGMVAPGAAKAYEGSGFTLADGSTSIAMETESFANSRGAKKYAEVLGYAMNHEPVSYGTLKGSEAGLKSAIDGALAMAGLTTEDIDAVFGFGNGLEEVDTVEKNVIGSEFFGKPVHNVRNITGEGRSASAALSVADAALTLAGKFNPVRKASYLGSEGATEKDTDTGAYKKVLAVSYGVGGSYSAVVLGKIQ